MQGLIITAEQVRRSDTRSGFVPAAKRWVVEQTHGTPIPHRRLESQPGLFILAIKKTSDLPHASRAGMMWRWKRMKPCVWLGRNYGQTGPAPGVIWALSWGGNR
ncbi:hypothetical protein [Actinoplanes sp. NPDC051411]|jgi:hypothetical protein|uniref:hypothetical protein n=1 Tax=Actinoplanes sp. NPDC051411 TaxID=3155522 RepID=UPI0034192E22